MKWKYVSLCKRGKTEIWIGAKCYDAIRLGQKQICSFLKSFPNYYWHVEFVAKGQNLETVTQNAKIMLISLKASSDINYLFCEFFLTLRCLPRVKAFFSQKIENFEKLWETFVLEKWRTHELNKVYLRNKTRNHFAKCSLRKRFSIICKTLNCVTNLQKKSTVMQLSRTFGILLRNF